MEEKSKLSLVDVESEINEKPNTESFAMKSSLKGESVLKREKVTSGNLPRRTVTRKAASEGVLERSRKIPADLRTNSAAFNTQRPRATSNLETAMELCAFRETSLIKNGVDTSTKPRRKISDTGSQRQRKMSNTSVKEQSNLSIDSRPSSKGQEKWAVRRTPSNELPKRKTSSGIQPAYSSFNTGRNDAENGSLESLNTKGTRQVRSFSDGDRSGTSFYVSTSAERREIIEKYIKDPKPKNDINNVVKSKAADKVNNDKKVKGIVDMEKQEGAKDDTKVGDGGQKGLAPNKGWGLLRKKLLEVTQVNDTESNEDGGNDMSSGAQEETQSTEKYLKMLRERLRKCEPADIVASSNVGEISKRKQDIERKRSVAGVNKKNSFFETVLAAHALSKEDKLNNRPTRKTSLSKIREVSDTLGQSLPDITYNSKFKSSPHFQKTIKLLGKRDFILENDNLE